MSLSAGEIAQVVEELAPLCEGAFVGKIRQPAETDLALELRASGSRRILLLSAHPQASRLHLTDPPKGTGEAPGGFVQLLRARLEGARVRTLVQAAGDRIVELTFDRRDDGITRAYHLIAELVGVRSNLHLLDESRIVIGSLHASREARARIGSKWRGPEGSFVPKPPRPFGGSGSYSERIAFFYKKELQRIEEASRRALIVRTLAAERKHLIRLVRNLEADVGRSDEAPLWREKGELLKTYAGQVPAGAKKVMLPRFDSSQGKLEIHLDPSLNPGENADRYFGRARKAARTREHAGARLGEARARLKKIERLVDEAADAPLDVLAGEVKALQIEPRDGAAPNMPQTSGERMQRRVLDRLGIRPRAFVSESGKEIYVGRNDRENDLLTTRFARPHDYFFHVSGAPGSHVIACVEKNDRLDETTLRRAAELALQYSSLGKSGRGEVSYTERRHVRKRKGDPPGAVHLTGPRKTVWVEVVGGSSKRTGGF